MIEEIADISNTLLLNLKEKNVMNDLYEACLNFRNAIIVTPKAKLSISFEEFPYGSCGDTCLILGPFLHDRSFGVFDYVCGKRSAGSHAWLENDGIIVDITAVQFKDCNVEVYVEKKTCFIKASMKTIDMYIMTH